MDLEEKFIEMRNKISKDIESIQTDEDKKQFAEKYEFSSEEVEVAIRKHKEWREAVKASDGVKRSSSNNMSGVDYSSDLDYTKQEVRRTNYQFMESIKKQSFKSIVSEISPEEITPELIETLRQNGYDGKSGHPVLQSYFQMYCRVQEADSRSKNAESKVYSLERALEDRDDEIKALRSREDLLQNTIGKQSEYIAKIKDRLQLMSTKLLGLQEQLITQRSEVRVLPPRNQSYIATAIKVVAIFYVLQLVNNNASKQHFYVELGKNWGRNPQKTFIFLINFQ